MSKLIIIFEDGREDVFQLMNDICVIGRTSDNDIALPLKSVSRKHCQIERSGSEYKIIDLGSRNGIKINGEMVMNGILKNGDKIDIGAVTMYFGEKPTSAAAPRPPKPAPKPKAQEIKPEEAVFVVYIVEGPDKGRKYDIGGSEAVTIGRNLRNTIYLSDTAASNYHAKIIKQGDSYYMLDMGSTNGIYYKGSMAKEIILSEGVEILIGDSLFKIGLPGKEMPAMDIAEEKEDAAGPAEAEKKPEAEGKLASVPEDKKPEIKAKREPLTGKKKAVIAVAAVLAVLIIALSILNTSKRQKDDNNMLGESGSFEAGEKANVPTGWTIFAYPQDVVPLIKLVEDDKKDGDAALLIASDAQDTRMSRIECTYSKEISVTSEDQYVLSGWIKTENLKGIAAYSIRFQNADGRTSTHTSKFLTGTADWEQVKMSVFAPKWAENMRVSCMKISQEGEGSAMFDGVNLVPGVAGAAPKPLKLWGDYYIEVSDNGLFALREGDKYLFWAGQFAPTGRAAGGSGNFCRQEFASVDEIKRGSSSIVIKGKFYSPVYEKVFNFTEEIASEKPEQAVYWETRTIPVSKFGVKLKISADEGEYVFDNFGFSAVLPKDLAMSSATTVHEGEARSTAFKDVRESEGVTEMVIFRPPSRIGMAFPSASFSRPEGEMFMLGYSGIKINQSGWACTLTFRSCPDSIKTDIARLNAIAQKAYDEDKDYSTAMKTVVEFLDKYGAISEQEAAKPKKMLEDLKKAKTKFEDEIALTAANIKASKMANDYRLNLKSVGEDLLAQAGKNYPEPDDALQKSLEELREALKDYNPPEVTKDPDSEKKLAMARKMLGDKNLSKSVIMAIEAVCFEVISKHPGTNYEQEAKRILERLNEAVKAQKNNGK